MKDIYRSLTENNGEAGILKNLLEEDELDALKTNPFHITGTDIRVRKQFGLFLKVLTNIWTWSQSYENFFSS